MLLDEISSVRCWKDWINMSPRSLFSQRRIWHVRFPLRFLSRCFCLILGMQFKLHFLAINCIIPYLLKKLANSLNLSVTITLFVLGR